MMKLPTGYGCETTNGDDAAAVTSNSNGRRSPRTAPTVCCAPASQGQQYHNLPVAPRPHALQLHTPPEDGAQLLIPIAHGSKFLRLADYAGKPILIVNVASHCNSTTKAYVQLNELAKRFPELMIIAARATSSATRRILMERDLPESTTHPPWQGLRAGFPAYGEGRGERCQRPRTL
ncbi:Thioredoxin-like fold [Phytophthora cactorum]|nr:Thioredoxin-like fold [Phytophthora cactorum]